MLDNIYELLQPISKFFYIVTHPRIIFEWIVAASYWIATLTSILALIFYVSTKSQKSKQILNGTIVAYILLKAIASVL